MIQLKVRLTGKAEKQFRELLDIPGSNSEDIVLDALAILYYATQEIQECKSKRVAIFDTESKKATPISLATLNLLIR